MIVQGTERIIAFKLSRYKLLPGINYAVNQHIPLKGKIYYFKQVSRIFKFKQITFFQVAKFNRYHT